MHHVMHEVQKKPQKPSCRSVSEAFFEAADGNRTRDLRITNATLYRLSHSSLRDTFVSATN